jgi:prenyltransferase beta subunit
MRRVLLAGLCLLVVSVPVRAQAAEEKKATVAWLRKLQAADGGFQPAPGKAPAGLRATTSALRALKYFGGEVPDRAACVEFVKSCFDKDSGGFADRPGGKPDVIATAVGIMAVVELKMPTEPYEAGALRYLGEHAKSFEEIRLAAAGIEALRTPGRTREIMMPPQVSDWPRRIYDMRNEDGTFGKDDGKARDTASAVVTLLRLRVTLTESPIKTLDVGQRKDGGFGKAGAARSDLETTYRVVRCYHMLKAKPASTDKCREFIASCRNKDGGYGVAPGEQSSTAATYFAGIVVHWLDDKASGGR